VLLITDHSPLTIKTIFMSDELYKKGMKVRRAVLGDAHVDKAEASKTDLDKDFQEYIINNAWSAVWSRPGLTNRERSLITIALLTALNHKEELAMHIRATKNTGATEDDVKEVLLHTAVYAGIPAANSAFKIAKEIFGNGGHKEHEAGTKNTK
jgi:4-carboxymuconolactone decarboxylase